jgi:hypothetical protein
VFALHPNFPNPFNPSTLIRFDLPEPGTVSLDLYDLLGRRVGELARGYYAPGYHSAAWNVSGDIASGVYFARLTVTDDLGQMRFTRIGKLLLVK